MRASIECIFVVVLAMFVVNPSLSIPPARGASSQSWSFRDDFNYTSMAQVQAAGWSINPDTTDVSYSSYGIHNSTLTLSTLSNPAYVARNDIPANTSNWSISLRSIVVSGLSSPGYGRIELLAPTVGHFYDFMADGYSNALTLLRNGQSVAYFPGYTPQANVWHVLQLDMISGTLYMYFDGSFLGNYTEPDKTPGNSNLATIKMWGSNFETNGFDWINVTNSPVQTSPFFKLAASPSSTNIQLGHSGNSTIQVSSYAGFSGNVSLNAVGPSTGPTVTLYPTTVNVPRGGSADSTLTVVAQNSQISAHYMVNVTASSGSLSSTATFQVTVVANLPIYINGNSGFTASNGVRSGSGTPQDPYVISDWVINLCRPGLYCGGAGILVNSTTASFVIRNVQVYSSGYYGSTVNAFGYDDADIYLLNVANGLVENSVLTSGRSGITVEGSKNVTLSGNSLSVPPIYEMSCSDTGCSTFLVSEPCLSVGSSTNIMVTANTLSSCAAGGIVLQSSSGVLVYHNNLFGDSTQSSDNNPGKNHWDNGYPSGGNYWSNYNGTDPDNDGIGDTAQTVCCAGAADHYPLMKSFSTNNNSTIAINGSENFQGVTVSTTGSLSILSGTFSGFIQVSATNSSTGAFLFSKVYTLTNLKSNKNQAMFILSVPVRPYPLSSDITIRLNGSLWSSTLAVTRQLGISGSGIVGIVDLATIAIHFDSTIGTVNYSPTADIAARGTIDIVDLATAAIYFDSPVYS